ncbi:hypothetical protein J4216_06185 [Candidatus Woesearchaeota archaeon]|nr:hypothetical protein [Candidatus Woesearchaeota archaeon]
MSLIKRFSDYEDVLIRKFHEHPFFRNFSRMSDEELRKYLAEKWHLSQNFVPWYDSAINTLNALGELKARDVLRKIVDDETPIGKPSHREDLLWDLERVGLNPLEILKAMPSKHTRKTLAKLHGLTIYDGDPNYVLRTMTALRTAGEILVAEEYRHVVPELERRFDLTPEQSRFYAFHFEHDRKDNESGEHTHSFGRILESNITDEDKLRVAIDATNRAYEVRAGFYDQFTKISRRMQIVKVLAASSGIAASLLLAYSLGFETPEGNGIPNEISGYRHCLDIDPMQRDSDRWLINRSLQTADTSYLKNVGKPEAVREVWGEGP